MKALFHLALSLIAAASLAGCFEPIQSGGVMIVGDPSERVGALCRFRHREAASDSFCTSDDAAPAQATARVRRMTSAAEGLKGEHASGTAGDYLLENDEIAVVINQPGSSEALLQTGGHIVDAGSVEGRTDALRWMATAFGSLLHQAAYSSIVSGVESDGSAWVEVAGHEQTKETLRVRTRYTLAPGSRAIAVATTLESTGPDAALDLGDVVCWGGADSAAAGAVLALRDGDTAETTAPYLLGTGESVAYAVAADGKPFFASHDASCSSLTFKRGETIAAPGKVTYERLLVVAPRGDTAAIATELFFLSGGTPGGVEVGITWNGLQPTAPGRVRVSLRRTPAPSDPPGAGAASAAFPDPLALWLAVPASGPLAAELPPGRYTARLEAPGVTSAETVALVEAGKVTRLEIVASIFDGASQIPQKD